MRLETENLFMLISPLPGPPLEVVSKLTFVILSLPDGGQAPHLPALLQLNNGMLLEGWKSLFLEV